MRVIVFPRSDHRSDETAENKALFLGTALAMDHYEMNAALASKEN